MLSTPRTIAIAACAWILMAPAMWAQSPPQMKMEVSIVASGKNNAPIEDLAASDVIVKDNNKRQEVLSFEKVTAGGPSAPNGPGLYDIVLIDCLNTTYRDLPENRLELLRVIKELSAAGNVTLLMLRQGLHIINDPASEAASMLQRFARQGAAGLEGGAANLEAYNWVFSDQLGLYQLFTPAGVFDRRRIEDSMGALRTIAANYHPRSGRKNLLWLSEGFPVIVGQDRVGGNDAPGRGRGAQGSDDGSVFTRDMELTSRVLNNANVAVYPIDARYLSVDDTKSSDRGTMQELANETGGLAFLSRKDVANAFHEALADTRTVYVLKYAISDLKYDGAFHVVKVETSRKDVKLRARKGYNAPVQAPK